MSSSGMNYGRKIRLGEGRLDQEADLQVATRMRLYLVWSEGVVVNLALYVAIRLPVVRKHLEEGGAS